MRVGFEDPLGEYTITRFVDELNINTFSLVIHYRLFTPNCATSPADLTCRVGFPFGFIFRATLNALVVRWLACSLPVAQI
tara:strand:+ start:5230 stop:5469 length:240 start_codon:yes stop_codon:yes gene_type:complete